MKHQTLATVLCISLAVTGCATTGQSGMGTDNTTMKCGLMAAGGAVLGGLVDGKRGVLRGAALGLGACAVMEVVSSRTRSSDEVEKAYRSGNRNTLPASARLVSYASSVSPRGQVVSGNPVKVQSTIRAVSGTGEPIREIREVLVAYAPDGKEFKRGEKVVDTTGGSGEFSNNFTLRLPQGAPEGNYRLQTDIYLNGKLASTNNADFSLVQAGQQRAVAAR